MPEEELLNKDREDVASIEENTVSYSSGASETAPGENDENENNELQYNMNESMSYVAIKGVFYTPKADNAGVFCIIYRGETGKVILRELWAIRSNKQPSSDVSDRWENFIKEMNRIGSYDKDSSDKLLPLIVQSLNNNTKEYLYRNIDEIENSRAEIRKALEKALHYVVDVKAEAELFGEGRAEKGGLLGSKDSSAAKEAEGGDKSLLHTLNLGGIPLICQPIINPISGCPVSKLRVGDVVHVIIPETNDIAKKIMDYVRLEGLVAAFPVTRVQVLESGNCAVVLRINDEISGVLNLPQDVMLKTNILPVLEYNFLAKLKEQLLNPTNYILLGLIFFIFLLLFLITRFIHF